MPAQARRVSRLTRFTNGIPVFISYAILGTTWAGFIFIVSLDEVLIRRGEIWHFAEQQIIYNTLCFLTVLSLFTASTRGPGYVDPDLDPEHSVSPNAMLKLDPAPQSRKRDAMDEDDIPLKFLKNAQWINTRIGKERPSPLPLRTSQRSRRLSENSDSDDSETSFHSPLAFVASPFVPATAAEAGEDETSEGQYSSASTIRAVLEGNGNSRPSMEQVKDAEGEFTDHDRLLPSGPARRSIMAKSNDGSPRWCRKCDAWKADRAHHCRFCHACSLKMDHHCVWIGTCVGYRNYKSFILFITYGTLLSIYGSLEAGYETFRFFRNPEEFYPNTPPCPPDQTCPDEMRLDLNPVIFMVIAILGGFFALAVGGLAGFHWWLASNNMTTLENMTHSFPSVLLADLSPGRSGGDSGGRWKPDHLLTRDERNRLRREAKAINVYDLGWRRNLRQVLGDGWMITRLWPLSRPRSRYRFGAEAGHFHEVDEDQLDQLKRLTRELRFGRDEEGLHHGQSDRMDGNEDRNGVIHSARSEGYRADAEEWSGDEEEGRTGRTVSKTEAWFEA